ncbi:hypothetical protein [Streptomyces meridianus]|uniref:Heparin binding hemagglutinin HbhA n=1 Tax=Streptomyces meridianus TaxID=2938945 RepID=A0ABT0X455_9ACTN|nr:hypothetical protein [Streptomyces meridianus]MCM2577329.1 hypothetical protein [Streptomyces meridianus]
MAITEDLRKTLTDPTPLYAAAGTADLAAEKLKEVPALIDKLRAEAPERIAAVRTADRKAMQERMTKQAKEAQATVQGKLNEVFGTLDTDIKKLREQAQGLALQGVGRAAEYAVKARETYDELAERGRGAVQNWRGEAAERVEDVAVAIESDPASSPSAKTKPVPSKPGDHNPNGNHGANGSTDAHKPSPPPSSRKTNMKKSTPPSAK